MTGLTIVALGTGVIVGLLLGGRIGNLGRHPLRWPAAVVVGAGAQGIAVVTGATGAVASTLVAVSYVGLAVFALANLALVGMALVVAGLVLNGTVMVLNGGMPVRAEAIAAVGADPDEVTFGPKHHLERPDGRVTGLGDVVPVPPTGEVVSAGDVALAAGVMVVVVQLLRPRRQWRRPAESIAAPDRVA